MVHSITAALLISVVAQESEAERVFKGYTDTITCLAWSKDGTRLASGSKDGTVRCGFGTR